MSHRPFSSRRRARIGLETLEGRQMLTGGFTEFALPKPSASQFVQVHDIVSVAEDQIAFATTQYGPSDPKTGQPTYQGTSLFKANTASSTVSTIHPQGDASRSAIYGLVKGSDGNQWGIVNYAPARLNADGSITRFALAEGSIAQAITPGPDGALYFTEPYRGLVANAPAGSVKSAIGRITTDGKITESILPDNAAKPDQITVGPDGALWYTLNDFGAGKAAPGIGRITTSGSITSYQIPNTATLPHSITAGPDGNVWFTAQGISSGGPTVNTGTNFVGKIGFNGAITLYPLPAQPENQKAGFVLGGITAGPDGNVWFTEPKAGRIANITPNGKITELPVPTIDSAPNDITLGKDGALWFTQLLGDKVGRYLPGPDLAASVTMASPVAGAMFSGAVASLTDNTPSATTSYAAMIDWGDGSAPTSGTLVKNGAKFDLAGSHLYASPGTYKVTVAAQQVAGGNVTATGAITVRTGQVASAKFDQAKRSPLKIKLAFDGPVNPAQVSAAARYSIVVLGPKNRRGVQATRAVAIRSVAYDASTNTIYLTPRGAINRRNTTRVNVAGQGTLTVS